MAKHQRQWNEYEAAILLEGLLEIINNGADRKDIVRRVSSDLRKMAQNQGEEIDEIFRNENGITLRLYDMENALGYKTNGFKATKMYSKVVEIYRTDRQQYNNLLREAHAMAEGSCEKEFRAWLSNEISQEEISKIYPCYANIETACKNAGIIKKSFFEITDNETVTRIYDFIKSDRSFRIRHIRDYSKYLTAVINYHKFIRQRNRENHHKPMEIIQAEGQKSFAENREKIEKKNIKEENSPKGEKAEKEAEPPTESSANKRLMEKYPSAYEKVFFALRELGSGEMPVSSVEIWEKIDHIEIISIVEEILNNATWSKKVVGGYYYKNHEAPKEPRERAPRPAPVVFKQLQHEAEYHNERYEGVLKKYFQKGYRLNSAIDLSKFKAMYKGDYGSDIPQDELSINNIIKMLCIVIGEVAYLPEMVWDEGLKKRVFEYIEKTLASNKSCVYYKVLGEKFKEDFIKCPIPLSDSPKNLKTCLEYFSPGGYYFSQSYVSKTAVAVPDIKSEVTNYLISVNGPATLKQISSALPHLPGDEIKSVLRDNDEFIFNGEENYFHESTLQISEGELEEIAQIIEKAVKDGGVLTRDELFSYINSQFPSIIEYNPGVTDLGLCKWLDRKYNGRFFFKGKIISSPNSKQSAIKLFANFARERESFTLGELKSYANSLGIRIKFNAVYENSVRVSKDKFVSRNNVKFNTYETDHALELICAGNYMALQKFNSYHALPQAEFPWNNFLLESYLASHSAKFRLMHESFNENIVCGAMVKRASGIKDFNGLLVQVLADSNIGLNSDSAINFLKKEGYIAKKKQSNIEDLIMRATAIRNGKGA